MSLDGRLNRIEAVFGTEPGPVVAIWCYCANSGPLIDPASGDATVYHFHTRRMPDWMPTEGGMYLIKEDERFEPPERPSGVTVEDWEEDHPEHDPEARAELVAQWMAILTPAQRRIAERARNIVVIARAESESGQGCEMTDEHYRDTTGFLPDDSQSD
jgi:hypothetical protein